MKTTEQEKTDTRVSFLQYLNTFLLTVCLVLLGIGVNQMVVFNEKYTTTINKVDKMEVRQSYQMDWCIERDRVNTDEHKLFDQRIDAIERELSQKKSYLTNAKIRLR